ncbi:MAG TPA: lamin tail domain-containing protein [bacterium]|nr:lamin tail domain-containing protein [bacterium]HPG46185.1 lamin tail domain-containing protein [bacterium]HPM98187.1 lamin tail domain-containing protein [bacterium]
MNRNLLLAAFLFALVFFVWTSGSFAAIVLNEAYSRGTEESPDWVEVYNDTDEPVDISGYKIYDGGGQSGSKPKKEFPAGAVVPAFGVYVITVDDTGADSDFGLSSGGDDIWLENAGGTVIDHVTIPAMAETESYQRIPDGGDWKLVSPITRGTSNIPVKMNEAYSRGSDESPDWIELYNSASDTVDISGYRIYDNGGQQGTKPKKVVPDGTTILPKGFFVIVTDNTGDDADFGLGSGGDKVWLEDSTGVVVDSVSFGALEPNQSYSRIPDGGTWRTVSNVTRGTSNAPVVMNEAYSRGSDEDPDWIELYNHSDNTVDISGYRIYDNGGQQGTKPKKVVPAGTTILPGGFFVIVTDNTGDDADFGLSSGGDKVWLEDSSGVIVDYVEFGALEPTQSYSRIPDGGVWQVVSNITRGASNEGGTAVHGRDAVITDFSLQQNYPNPFNPTTRIAFNLEKAGNVRLAIYNLSGQLIKEVVNAKLASGSHQFTFDGAGLASGVYLYSLQTSEAKVSKRMLLMK